MQHVGLAEKNETNVECTLAHARGLQRSNVAGRTLLLEKKRGKADGRFQRYALLLQPI
jgi:hypothetical protein